MDFLLCCAFTCLSNTLCVLEFFSCLVVFVFPKATQIFPLFLQTHSPLARCLFFLLLFFFFNLQCVPCNRNRGFRKRRHFWPWSQQHQTTPPESKCLCFQLLHILKIRARSVGGGLSCFLQDQEVKSSLVPVWGAPWKALQGHLLCQKLVGIFSFQKPLCVVPGTWHLRNVGASPTCCPLTQPGSACPYLTSLSPHFTLLNKSPNCPSLLGCGRSRLQPGAVGSGLKPWGPPRRHRSFGRLSASQWHASMASGETERRQILGSKRFQKPSSSAVPKAGLHTGRHCHCQMTHRRKCWRQGRGLAEMDFWSPGLPTTGNAALPRSPVR